MIDHFAACAAYVDEVAPEKLATLPERSAIREAWLCGYRGQALPAIKTGAPLLAWAAGQRFPGAAPYVAPAACASVPKSTKRPCRDCQPGKPCATCRRQIPLFEEPAHARQHP